MKTCAVEGCGRKHYAKGLCTKHYQRVLATGTAEPRIRPAVCAIEGCGGKVRGHGLCLKHYTRVRRYGDPHATALIVGDDKSRLLAHYKISESRCWEWQGFKNNGYGISSLNGKSEHAHRVSWKVHKGEIPDELQINHRCHNRACINPEHLYTGSQKQNMDDMYAAGRNAHAKGEANGNVVLSAADVIEIKMLIRNGGKNYVIAARYGVAPTTISSIRTGKTWRHLDGTEAELLEQTRRETGIVTEELEEA